MRIAAIVAVGMMLASCSLSIGGRYSAEPVRAGAAPVIATGKNCTMLIRDEVVTVAIIGLKDGDDPCKHFR